MIKVVLDTFIFVRALINPGSICGRLAFELHPRYRLVMSPEILREVLEVLNRPALRLKHFEQVSFDQVLTMLTLAELVEPKTKITVCRDEDDDKFPEAAIAGNAQYLVTEDQDLLVLGQYGGVQVTSALSFLRLLEKSD